MIASTPTPLIPYPWQQPYWQDFLLQYERERLPHALLLSGQQGIGKWHFALTMADYLLCLAPRSGLACGQCRACQLNHGHNHPDKYVLAPEESGKLIKVDQVRQLSTKLAGTAQQGGRKVIVLGPVEQLNTNAANALLKNLEEPTADTFFILISHSASAVMATIRSRCQIRQLTAPEAPVALQWLQELGLGGDYTTVLSMAAGAPLTAKDLLENQTIDQLGSFFGGLRRAQQQPSSLDIGIVKDWLDIDLTTLLSWWQQLLHRIVTYKFIMPPVSISVGEAHNFTHALAAVLSGAVAANPQWLFRFMDKLQNIKKQSQQGANPNKQLVLEELLLDWYAIIKQLPPLNTRAG